MSGTSQSFGLTGAASKSARFEPKPKPRTGSPTDPPPGSLTTSAEGEKAVPPDTESLDGPPPCLLPGTLIGKVPFLQLL